MESLNLNVRVDANDKKRTNPFDETIYEKLKEAELEMVNNARRYSKEEVLKSMNNIIG